MECVSSDEPIKSPKRYHLEQEDCITWKVFLWHLMIMIISALPLNFQLNTWQRQSLVSSLEDTYEWNTKGKIYRNFMQI